MFIYMVALAATLFIIFGLLRATWLNDRLQSSYRYSLNLYNGLTRRPMTETRLQNENLQNNLISERPIVAISEWGEHDGISVALNNVERVPDSILEGPGIKARSLKPRFNFEDIPLNERNIDSNVPVMRTLQIETAKNDAIGTSKQEGNENLFESLKNSIEKATANQSLRLSTKQMYNLLVKETMKENEAKQKLMDSLKNKLTETPNETKTHLPSSSKTEHEDNLNKSKSNDTI